MRAGTVTLVALGLALALLAAACSDGQGGRSASDLFPSSTVTPPTLAPPPTTPPRTYEHFTAEPYEGLGAWLDVFDWTEAWADPNDEPLGSEAIDRMASFGVKTIYIQAARSDWEGDGDVVEPERLAMLIERAHEHDMAVVGWYLPTHRNTEDDLRRLLAVADLPIDGIAVDIESPQVENVSIRNNRLIGLSLRLRSALPGAVIGGIVLPPYISEIPGSTYWPDYPFKQLEPYYDVWLPMTYWSNRRSDSEWSDPTRYVGYNVDRLRELLDDPDAPVHVIGGIADEVDLEAASAMLLAAQERDVIGGSLYDYDTTLDETWSILAGFG